MNFRLWSGTAALALALTCPCADAQQPPTQPDATLGEALRSLASRAHDIFSGQIIAITHKGGVVEIVFRIEQPVAGAQASTYTLREWGGLWTAGQQRYWVGERALVFVHAAGAAGLSSPVDGAEGVLPVMVQGNGVAPLVDVRRLAARVQRRVVDPLEGEDTGAVTLTEAASVVSSWRKPVWREPRRRPIPVAFRPIAVPPQRLRMIDPETDTGAKPGIDLSLGLSSLAARPEPLPGVQSGGRHVR